MVACPASALPGIGSNPPNLLFSEPAISFLPPIFSHPESWRSLPEVSRLFGPQSELKPEALSALPPLFYFSALALLGEQGRDLGKAESFLWSLIELDYSRPGKPPRFELAEELREAGFQFPQGVIPEAEKWLSKKCASDWEIALRCALCFLLQFIEDGIYAAVPTATGLSEGTSTSKKSPPTQFEKRCELQRILVRSVRQAEADGLIPKVCKTVQDVQTGRWEKVWVWRSDLIEQCHRASSIRLAPDCHTCRRKRQVKNRSHSSCHDPLCPHCQHARALRIEKVVALFFEEMHRRATAREQSVKFATLTLPNVEHLAGVRALLNQCHTRLRHRKLYSSRVLGSLSVTEVTNTGNGWHPHIHKLMDSDWWDEKSENGKYEFSKLWKSCLPKSVQALIEKIMPEGSKDRSVTWLKEADGGTVQEMSKYIAKGSGFYHDPERVAEFYREFKGQRLFEISGPGYQRLYRLYREMEKRVKAGYSLIDFESFWSHYMRVVEGSKMKPANKAERLKDPQEMVPFFYSAKRSLEEVARNLDSDFCPHGVPLVDAGPLDDPHDLSWQDGVPTLSEVAFERALERARSP